MKKLILLLLWLMLAVPCAAEIIIVDNDWPYDFNDIQAAINYSDNGDIIVVFPGTYYPHYEGIKFWGKAVTVTSVDPHDPYIVAATIIEPPTSDSRRWGRGFYLANEEGPDSVIDGLTIRNCFYWQHGAGIGCYGSSPTISNCVITGNYTYDSGAGICSYGGSPTISNCIITGNNSDDHGGGIYCQGGSPQIINCAINGNSAGNGAGVYLDASSADISNSCFTANTAAQNGGAIYSHYYYSLAITNCTFTVNSAQNTGGGIFSYSPQIHLTNCILWGNTDSTGTNQSAQITYSPSPPQPPQITYSCIQDDNPNDVNVPFGGIDNGNIDDEPMFARYPDDGGNGWGDDPCTPDIDEGANDDFGDLRLQKNSPCINAGVPNFFIQPSVVDMDGQPRVLGCRIDMGAYEYAPMTVVTSPKPDDVWTEQSRHTIRWSGYGVETADILLSTDAGQTWQTISSSVPADVGKHTLNMPAGVDSSQCTIAVVPSVADPNVICIESGLFTIHPDFIHPAVPSKWKSVGGNFQHTGLSENFGPELGCTKWQFQTDGPVAGGVTIGPADRVHIACDSGKVYTLDSYGNLIWTYDTNSPLLSSPTVGPDGSLYVGSESGKLYAISIGGTLRWTHNTNGFIYSSPAVSGDGSIYAASQDGTLYALGSDGSELWTFKTDGFGMLNGSIMACPAIAADGTIYIGGLYDPNLYALEPNNGNVKWVCNFEYVTDPCDPANNTKRGRALASPVVGGDGTIYQTLLCDPNLYAIESNYGNIIWSTNLADPCSELFDAGYAQKYMHPEGRSEPVLGPDGTIYISLNDPYLRAVDPNGNIKWVTRLGMEGGFTLTVGSDGLVYAACDDGYLCVVNSDGQELSRFSAEDRLSLPVIPAEDTIIVAGSKDHSFLITDANNTVWAIGSGNCGGQFDALRRPQDLMADLKIDMGDLALLAENWLDCTDAENNCLVHYYGDTVYPESDINRNLYVDFVDFAALANRWLSQE